MSESIIRKRRYLPYTVRVDLSIASIGFGIPNFGAI